MWQRIQTLYLLISTGLIASLFFCNKTAELRYTDYLPYLILLIIVAVLDLLALTTWKHRIFQMRTAILSALITLALQARMGVDYFTASERGAFNFTLIFPIVSVILNVMAAGCIWGDELIVRSSSRLRAAKRKR